MTAYVNGMLAFGKEASATVTAMLDLMDANPGAYIVDNGPPVKLLFRDETVLARYRQLKNSLLAVIQRQSEAQAWMINSQSDGADRLTDLLKR